jgi:uncharacterized protein YbgA (DUF1722 family)
MIAAMKRSAAPVVDLPDQQAAAHVEADVQRRGVRLAHPHAFGGVGKGLDRARREDLLTHIEAYRRGQAPLSVPVALLPHHASSGTLPWLAGQTYLQPFPAELRLRHSVPRRLARPRPVR